MAVISRVKVLLLVGLLALLLAVLNMGYVIAQSEDGDTCSASFDVAFDTVSQACSTLDDNEACYGNRFVESSLRSNNRFTEPGDRVNLADVLSFRLSAYDELTGNWGILKLLLLVNLPSSTLEEATILMFGDVQAENGAQPRPVLNATVSWDAPINSRLGPNGNAGIAAVLQPGQTVEAIGRLENNLWLRIRIVEENKLAWVYSGLMELDGDIGTLLAEDAQAPYYGPMQAISLSNSGEGDNCAGLITDGVLIQTPEGVARVTFLVNEVSIDMFNGGSGSAAVLTQNNGTMSVNVLQGSAQVTANGGSYIAPQGSRTRVQMGSGNTASGTPSSPEPYNLDEFQVVSGIAGGGLNVSGPASWDTIQQVNGGGPNGGGPSGDGTVVVGPDGQVITVGGGGASDPNGGPAAPGGPCERGRSCEAPGQNKDNGAAPDSNAGGNSGGGNSGGNSGGGNSGGNSGGNNKNK